MSFRVLVFSALVLLSLQTFAQIDSEESKSEHPGQETLVRCTQFSPVQGNYRFNVRIFKDLRTGEVYADVHAVNNQTNYGKSISLEPVTSQVAQHSPLIVTYWNRSFILKVPVQYKRGSSIVDYTIQANGEGALTQGDINYYMNCFTVKY